jgi:hypothetical protein
MRADGVGAGVAATLDVSLGRLAAALDRQERRHARLSQLLHLEPIMASLPGSGTFDQPDTLGPRDGYWWDLRSLVASGWSAGTVTMFINSTAAAQQAQWTVPGENDWSGQKWLGARDRLIFVAAGITGNVQIQGWAIAVSNQVLAEYLM